MARRRSRRNPRHPLPELPAPADAYELSRRRRQGEGFRVAKSELSASAAAEELADEEVWRQSLPTVVAELNDLFAGHDAFAILAALQAAKLSNEATPASRQNPFLDSTTPAEYASLVLLERPRRQSIVPPERPLREAIPLALPRLEFLVQKLSWAISGYATAPSDPVRSLQQRFVSRYVFVPFNETPEQARRQVQELFEIAQVESALVELTGVGVEDALRMSDAILRLLSADGSVYFDVVFGDTAAAISRLTFSPTVLAREAGVTVTAAESLLRLISIPFGQEPGAWPRLPTTLRQKPILRDDEGNYFAPEAGLIARGFRSTFSAVLNPAIETLTQGSKRGHQAYLTHRAQLLEQQSEIALERFLRPDFVQQNLKFRRPGPNGAYLYGEIDGLLIIDDVILMLQAKSGPTRVDAVVHDQQRFREMVQGIVTESIRQHDDAQKALQSPDTEYWIGSGRTKATVSVPIPAGARIFPITVSLDDLSGCAPVGWELIDGGLAPVGSLPWLIGAAPLDIVLGITDYPAQLIQFLTMRVRLNESRNLDVSDEVDIYLEFLATGLEDVYDVRHHDGSVVTLLPPERFHDLGDWLAAEQGAPKARRPHQKFHGAVRRLIELLDRDRPQQWLEASIELLDVPRILQDRLGAVIARAWREADGGSHGLTYTAWDGSQRALSFAKRPDNMALNRASVTAALESDAVEKRLSRLTVYVLPSQGAGHAEIVTLRLSSRQ